MPTAHSAVMHGSIVVDGVRSSLVQSGDTTASEAVVFTHGSPGCAEEFSALVAQTGEFARAIAIDMPGFGGADKPRPRAFEYSAANIGVHLAKQLEALGVERAHFVGHDFGGAFNLLAAAYSPDRVGSIVMINSGLMRGYSWHRIARIYRTPLLGELFMMIANERGFAFAMRSLPDWLVAQMWSNFDRATRRAVLALYRATPMGGQAEQLPAIRMLSRDWPALVIFGADDPYLPAALAARNQESLPNASIELIEGAGHWPHAEAPQATADVLLPFLQANAGS
ncbi:MAG: alpha/beta fold hydrolase [Solirubrobacterales bacterium]